VWETSRGPGNREKKRLLRQKANERQKLKFYGGKILTGEI